MCWPVRDFARRHLCGSQIQHSACTPARARRDARRSLAFKPSTAAHLTARDTEVDVGRIRFLFLPSAEQTDVLWERDRCRHVASSSKLSLPPDLCDIFRCNSCRLKLSHVSRYKYTRLLADRLQLQPGRPC